MNRGDKILLAAGALVIVCLWGFMALILTGVIDTPDFDAGHDQPVAQGTE